MRERVLVMDGAMGTTIQRLELSEQEFRGERFADWDRDVRGNNDLLVLTHFDVDHAGGAVPAPTRSGHDPVKYSLKQLHVRR